jgi:hypothetical protein
MPRLPILIVAGLIGASSAHARCGIFGTQLECGLGAGEVVMGTQIADEPRHADTPVRYHSLQGSARPFMERLRLADRVRIEVQDIGTDPSLCRRIGNEGYCY